MPVQCRDLFELCRGYFRFLRRHLHLKWYKRYDIDKFWKKIHQLLYSPLNDCCSVAGTAVRQRDHFWPRKYVFYPISERERAILFFVFSASSICDQFPRNLQNYVSNIQVNFCRGRGDRLLQRSQRTKLELENQLAVVKHSRYMRLGRHYLWIE